MAKKASKKTPDPRTRKSATLGQWISAARIRTLTLAVAPVAFGTGVASIYQSVRWLEASLCLAVAVFLQIGVNYANDYSDGIRGTDNDRVGPFRLTASGKVQAKLVRNVAFVFLALGAAAGLTVALVSNHLWLIGVGGVALLAAWFYTGGKRPYGYAGLGEIVAFLFFGPVAVFGTAYVQVATMFDDSTAIMVTTGGAVSIGLLAAAVLLANNLRDLNTDAPAGKKTVSVRFGTRTSQVLFTLFVLVGMVQLGSLMILYPLVVFAFAAYLLLLPAVLIVWTYRQPAELVLALKLTSLGALVWGVVGGWGLHAFLLV